MAATVTSRGGRIRCSGCCAIDVLTRCGTPKGVIVVDPAVYLLVKGTIIGTRSRYLR